MKSKKHTTQPKTGALARIKWTLLRASTEFGVTREALRRNLVRMEIEVGPHSTYSTRDIFHALAGDLEAERIRETRARADLLELEHKEKLGDLVPLADVQTMLRDCLLPVRQRLMALPSEAASRVNPTDPQFAREALQKWVDDSLPTIRGDLPKTKSPRKK